MIADKYTMMTFFDILSPRWHDKKVLLKASKVDKSKNKLLKIKFQKAPEGYWVIEKSKAKRFPIESNGVIQCYVIPLAALEPLQILEKSVHDLR